jgi:hypothetical protein
VKPVVLFETPTARRRQGAVFADVDKSLFFSDNEPKIPII